MADEFEWNGDEPETEYDPSSVEVDRARQQGLGMGARDLARQRDPQGTAPAAEIDEGDDAAPESAPSPAR